MSTKNDKAFKYKKTVYGVSILALLISGFFMTTRLLAQPDETLNVRLGQSNDAFALEVADTQLEQARGLMNRDSLDATAGMVFFFPEAASRSFWMKNTRIPLDMIWLNQGTIVGITKNATPDTGQKTTDLPLYDSPAAIDAVIELNGGAADRYGIIVGQHVQFDR
mgnify:CR=1 FL=1